MNFRASIVAAGGWLLVLSFALVWSGCTAVQKTPPASKKASEPYRIEKEGTIPPVPSDAKKEVDHVEKYEDLPAEDDSVTAEDIEPESVPAAPPAAQTPVGSTEAAQRTMQGYRIQIFASGSEPAARSVREAAEVRIGAPAYVEFVDGVYKVRVGDCPSRPEAETLLQRCRDAGYADAWIAAGTIFLPPVKTTP
jgi:cell division septation protein DedD